MSSGSSRLRVYDFEAGASKMRRTFSDRDVEFEEEFSFGWPSSMQNVGDSLAVAYSSDKWKPKGADGKRALEDYKHIAESRNRVYVRQGLLCDFYAPSQGWPVIGPKVSFARYPMPKHFTIIGLFEEINLRLHTGGTNDKPKFARGDDGIVKVTVRHGMLGASKILWSKDDPMSGDEPFLFVYTKSDGVLMLVTGDKLDVEADGIVG